MEFARFQYDVTRSVGRRRTTAVLRNPLEPFVMLVDGFAILIAGVASSTLYNTVMFGTIGDVQAFLGISIIAGMIFLVLAKSSGAYRTHVLGSFPQFKEALFLWTLTLACTTAVVFLLKAGSCFSRGSFVCFALTGEIFLVLHRALWGFGFVRPAQVGGLERSAVVLSAATPRPRSRRLADLQRHGYRIVQLFEASLEEGRDWELKQVMARLTETVREAEVEEILVLLDWSDLPAFQRLSTYLRAFPLPVRLLPDETLSQLVQSRNHEVGDSIAVDVQRAPLSRGEQLQKRCLDIFCAVCALIGLSPILLLTALAIKLDTSGPVLFKQRRRGFNGKEFKILKFRSMTVLEDGSTIRQAERDDNRITAVGRWIRRTSIDELPQLWNVLRGEMSIVGPRPHAVAHDEYYDPLIETYAFRHHVKPGLTGWAQIHGHRGETPDVDAMMERVEFDVWYVNNWSLALDIFVIVATTWELIRTDKAY